MLYSTLETANHSEFVSLVQTGTSNPPQSHLWIGMGLSCQMRPEIPVEFFIRGPTPVPGDLSSVWPDRENTTHTRAIPETTGIPTAQEMRTRLVASSLKFGGLGSKVSAVKRILITARLLENTIRELRKAGRHGTERLVLWLGRNGPDECEVDEVFSPPQVVTEGSFWIDERSMQAILRRLRSSRLAVVAQVHSHPRQAFHSLADDTWAIVRHVGALSVVVPNFALQTTIKSFATDVAGYELTAENQWREVPGDQFAVLLTVAYGKTQRGPGKR